MKKKLRLMGDNILVRMDAESNRTASGVLFKPDDALETILRTGEVIAVGPGKFAKRGDQDLNTRVPICVEVGEGVVFNRFVATHTKTAEALHQFALDKDEALIKPSDILLVYDRKEPINFG